MIKVALRVVERRLGLRIFRESFQRQIGIAEQLVQSRIALLDGEFGLQLCGYDRGQSSVEIGLGSGLRTDQFGLAINVALLEVDVFLREFGECVQGLEIALQLVEIAARGVKLGFDLRESKRERFAVEAEQLITRIDVLTFADRELVILPEISGVIRTFCAPT